MLYVTGCKKEQLGGYDQPIPCEATENGKLRVIEDVIEARIIQAWKKRGKQILIEAGLYTTGGNARLGFDLTKLPIGATITVVKEE